ncbi:lipocalin family protein [Gemmobacter denitrificans]|uniref:Lipocalin family protein n=1 Tax=Gemmobacter denitrificans TaxID=3123040 RepID=A0ABU8BWC7_9RHOB
MILLALLVLAACMPGAQPDRRVTFRDRAAPIWSNAVVQPGQLAGDWQQVAAFATAPGGCALGRVRIGQAQPSGVRLEADLCLNGARMRQSGLATVPGPGRLAPQPAGPGIAQPWWILWADVDLRTLVIGTPTGEMGFILNRGGSLPPDRWAAAREILIWNGYDLSRLQRF